MGGGIEAQSTPGAGRHLHRHPAAAPGSPRRRSRRPPPPPTAEDLPGLQVLLAEDHPTNQRVVRLILEAVGVELTVVDNGALALDAFARQRFDLVLMDMQMPEMDGLTATAELRVHGAGRPARRGRL